MVIERSQKDIERSVKVIERSEKVVERSVKPTRYDCVTATYMVDLQMHLQEHYTAFLLLGFFVTTFISSFVFEKSHVMPFDKCFLL